MEKGDKLVRGYKPNQFSAPDIFSYEINISANAKLTYLFLDRHYAIEGDRAPSKNEIAYYLECSKRTADSSVNELLKIGLVRAVHRKIDEKVNDTNYYIIYHPEQIGLKKKRLYEEVKMEKAKKRKKGSAEIAPSAESAPSAKIAPPEKVVQNLHHPSEGSAEIAPPHENHSNDADSQGVVQNLHGSSLLDSLDSLDRLEDDPAADLSDEDIIKVAFKHYLKQEITNKQAEQFVDVAFNQGLTLDEVIEEIKYIAFNVTIKTTPDAALFASLKKGGWAKKKREEEKKEQKPKRRLARSKKVDKLPKAIEMAEKGQAKPSEQQQPQDDESLEAKQARIRAKLKLMNERLENRQEVEQL